MDRMCGIFFSVVLLLLLHQSMGQQDPNTLVLPGVQPVDGTGSNQQQQSPQVDPFTTTTPSPRFTACVNACRTIQNYNPVCGSDGVTYSNEFRLQCARRCGQQVELVRGGSCVSL